MPEESGRAGSGPLTICDLTQSWSPSAGGGITTYLREKRDYVLRETPHHLLQIVPGEEDRVTVEGRHILAEVGADPVRGSPDYRFILRTGVVRELLECYRPDIVESLCPWILPWTAIRHRRRFPATALVAGYHTDFPVTHVHRTARRLFGEPIGTGFRWLANGYAEITYREFDHVYTLSDPARAALARRKITRTSVVPLGVDLATFNPDARDPGLRAELGLPGNGPLLVYAGRVDNEKRADRLIAMMRQFPPEFGAALMIVGDGKLRGQLEAEAHGLPIRFLGFEADRARLARLLASSDIYVSAMADETFGLSVIEAQSCGLPVVGVAAGAMSDRVPAELGLLGRVDDASAMAINVARIWTDDHRAIGTRARQHVAAAFGWDATFAHMFDTVYAPALARAERRIRLAGAGGSARDRTSGRPALLKLKRWVRSDGTI